MITFQIESSSKVFTKEFNDLFKDQWRELGAYDKRKTKMSINWDFYKNLAKNNILMLYTARDDNMLIGYSVFIILTHPHYNTTKIAENDTLYLIPRFRKGYTGYNFVKFFIEDLKTKVDIINMNSSINRSFEVIMQRLGLKLIEYKFSWEN